MSSWSASAITPTHARFRSLFLRASETGHSKRQMRRLGVQDYLNKPVNFDELRETIVKYIPLRRLPEMVLKQM